MTEEEAKQKWCPFAKPGQTLPDLCGEIRGNREMTGAADPGALCLGSDCMAWRWSSWTTDIDGERIGLTGYCGLVQPNKE
jgi:hypothetical protein